MEMPISLFLAPYPEEKVFEPNTAHAAAGTATDPCAQSLALAEVSASKSRLNLADTQTGAALNNSSDLKAVEFPFVSHRQEPRATEGAWDRTLFSLSMVFADHETRDQTTGMTPLATAASQGWLDCVQAQHPSSNPRKSLTA